MSTKLNKLVLLSALMIAIIGTFGTVSAEEIHNLVAGGDQVVGNVAVSIVDENISVTFTTIDGWLLNETHLHIANLSEDEIPQTKKGNPRPGQFDYSEEHVPGVTEYTYVIPLDGFSGDVYIAAHAVVQKPVLDEVTGEPVLDEESAWGNDNPFKGKNWAMYSTYTLPTATEEPTNE